MESDSWITPAWPAPPNVRAFSTTRIGGYSGAAHRGLNLAGHVGDNTAAVRANRQWLCTALKLPAEPLWLRQIHGARVVPAQAAEAEPPADGSFTDQPGVVCAVLTADCLPLLLCDKRGTRVGAAHVGWRGLAAGIIETAVNALDTGGTELMA